MIPSWRISNGKIWVEHLAESLHVKLEAEDQYAVAGARSDHDNFAALAYGLLPRAGTGLQSQISDYLDDSGPGGADPDALHTVWIGANDVFTTLTISGDMNLTVYNAIQNTAEAVVDLMSHGARHILVVNVPDLGLTPFGLSMGQESSAGLSYLTNVYNDGLAQTLDHLAATGVTTIRMDAAGLIREIAADPASFRLVNATEQALSSGGNASNHLFWDGVHSSTAGYKVIADRVIEELVAFHPPRRGHGEGPGVVHSLNGLVHASCRYDRPSTSPGSSIVSDGRGCRGLSCDCCSRLVLLIMGALKFSFMTGWAGSPGGVLGGVDGVA